MHQFFVTPMQVKEDHIYIEGLDVNHIKNVLRMKVGEALKVSDGNNRKYLCEIGSMTAQQVCVRIVEEQQVDTELPSKIYLFQGLPKSDKKKALKKVERWRGIAESGAKQSGRNVIPKVTNVMSYKDALTYARGLDVLLIPYELAEGMKETKQVIEEIKRGQSVGIFIGPEGGFETQEVEDAIANGARAITLGKRILRTETAGLTTLSILMYHLEE